MYRYISVMLSCSSNSVSFGIRLKQPGTVQDNRFFRIQGKCPGASSGTVATRYDFFFAVLSLTHANDKAVDLGGQGFRLKGQTAGGLQNLI